MMGSESPKKPTPLKRERRGEANGSAPFFSPSRDYARKKRQSTIPHRILHLSRSGPDNSSNQKAVNAVLFG